MTAPKRLSVTLEVNDGVEKRSSLKSTFLGISFSPASEHFRHRRTHHFPVAPLFSYAFPIFRCLGRLCNRFDSTFGRLSVAIFSVVYRWPPTSTCLSMTQDFCALQAPNCVSQCSFSCILPYAGARHWPLDCCYKCFGYDFGCFKLSLIR